MLVGITILLVARILGEAISTAPDHGPNIGDPGREQQGTGGSPETPLMDLTEAANVSTDIPKWVDEWTAPKDIRKLFPFYVTGYDENGSPVWVLEYGNFKITEALRGLGGREQRKIVILKYLEQAVYQILRDGLAKNEQGVGCILDWNGFSLANFADTMAVEVGLQQLSMLNKLHHVLNYAFLINTNFAAENFLRMGRPFLGNILERCEIFGNQRNKWLPKLLRKIPQSQLAPWYGGSEDWRPVWIGGGAPVTNSTKGV